MALLPPFYLDCVVALGTKSAGGQMNWVGTGFLYGHLINKQDYQKRPYAIFLVTTCHLVKELKNLWVRFNSIAGQPCQDLDAVLSHNAGQTCHMHSDNSIDVAVLPINYAALIQNKLNVPFFQSDNHVLSTLSLKNECVAEGDGVFVLGFPMGMVQAPRQCVICRTGCIARIRDLIESGGNDFLIDVTVFPGNSGGPVILRPELTSIQGTKSIGRASLIGMVTSYVPYQDVALSRQTKRPRVIFEENTGLTAVVPVDRITEVIAQALPLLGQNLAACLCCLS